MLAARTLTFGLSFAVVNSTTRPAFLFMNRIVLHTCSLLHKQRKNNSSTNHFSKPKLPRVTIMHNMTIAELAIAVGKDIGHVFECLKYIDDSGRYRKADSIIDDLDVIISVVKLSGFKHVLGHRKTISQAKESKDVYPRPPPDTSVLIRRPPIVTIMGHVDHGKTTLLDAIRNSHNVDLEFGGITQHIGAFSVDVGENRKITFIDTPGHAAFAAMRQRGALITDIVVLMVAADDGVMPQTVESIKHARAAGVPIIVAINKIDKSNIDLDKVKHELLNFGIQLEELGGDVIGVHLSALKRLHLDTLLDSILTIADLNNISGDPTGPMEGTVIDSKIDKQLGIVSSVIVERGQLKKGAYLVSDLARCKVRKILDEHLNELVVAELSQPVQVVGWKQLPHAGDKVLEVASERVARTVIEWRTKIKKQEKIESDYEVIAEKQRKHLEEYREQLRLKRETGAVFKKSFRPAQIVESRSKPVLPIVLKGDVDGSVDAILNAIDAYHSNLCDLEVIHFGIGDICESDIDQAMAFNGLVYGFNVVIPPSLKNDENSSVVRIHNVIYHLLEDMKLEMSERTLPIEIEEPIGEAIVLQVFDIDDKKRKEICVAGCRCISGTLNKLYLFKLIRNNEIIHRDRLFSMKHLKDNVQSVSKGIECGLAFENTDIRFEKDDRIVCYKLVSSKPAIEWDFCFDHFSQIRK